MKKGPATRAAILEEAFRLTYAKGYQQTSIDEILKLQGITKGAFYHHFENKDQMGLALIEELLAPRMRQMYEGLLAAPGDPLHAIHRMMRRLLFDEPALRAEYGCPAGNLAQELGPGDSHMRAALSRTMMLWEESIRDLLKRGSREGHVRKGMRLQQVAAFLIAGYWGARTLGKTLDAAVVYNAYLTELGRYLDTLRPA